MKSHVITALKEYDRITGARITVAGNQVRYIANDGSYVYVDFSIPIADLLKGGSASATVRAST